MWIYDLTTLQFLAVNNAAVERYGYERAEFLAMTIEDIRPPEDVERLLKDVSQPRPPWQSAGNWHHRLKSGQIIDVDITSHTITFAGQSAALVVAQDITERKRAEEEIRQRAQLSALGAAARLALADSDTLANALQRCAEALVSNLGAALARIWILDERDGAPTMQASAGLYTLLNGPPGNVSFAQFKIERIVRERVPHMTNTVIGDPQVNDQEWARREGMVAFAGYPLMIESRVVGVMALFARHALSDAVISALASVADHIALGIERHRSAEALGIAEERMRFALEAAGVGIWDMDYTTGVLRWSTILEAQYGLQPGTFGGTFEALVERIHPDDRESALGIIGKAMKSGGDFQRQNRALWPDGTVRWLSGAGRILLGEHGEPVRGVGISIDVTERQTLEEQFLQAQKMEAIGRLAGGVAHDFNNLLTVILGFCELLLANVDPDDPRQADIIEIQKAGTRAAGLTRQLLTFSRKEIIEPTRLDLNEVMANMRVMLGRLIGEDVTVVLGLGPELAFVTADRGQVEQIVLNLAVNARDAMPKGGTLTIETANVELDEHYAKTHVAVKPGPYVALTVTDTGTGMTPQVQARLFEPFFTTKEPGKGTGLGLATVQGVVARSGGSVTVSSEVGRGTSFTVYFPRAAAAMVIEPPKPIAQLPAGAQTVLVVEDEDALRALAKRLLEQQGYTVLVASNADEALELFEGNPSIDVLLTDVVMPGTSGAELTRQLMERRPALKVLYMSGYTEDAISQHGVLKPGIALLHKPFTSEPPGGKTREVLGLNPRPGGHPRPPLETGDLFLNAVARVQSLDKTPPAGAPGLGPGGPPTRAAGPDRVTAQTVFSLPPLGEKFVGARTASPPAGVAVPALRLGIRSSILYPGSIAHPNTNSRPPGLPPLALPELRARLNGSRGLLAAAPLPHAIAFAFRREHGGVMRQPIEERRRQLLVAGKHGHPFGKREIGGDDGRASLVPIGEEIEEQLAADAIERHKPELVDDQHVDAEQPLLQPGQLAGIARFDQLTHEIGRPGEEHASFLLRRFHAERDREMRLAGPDRAGEDQILGRGDPLAARERVDLGRADAVGGREVEGIEGLHLGKARLAEPLADHGLVPRRLLRGEHLVEVVFVGPVRIARLTGQGFERARDAGQFQRAGLRDDEIAGEGAGAHATPPRSQPS